LSGFIGKLLILDATRGAPHASLIWTTILGASLLMMIGYARAGSMIFWNNTEPVPSSGGAALGRAPDRLTGITLVPILVIAVLLAATAALSLGAGPFTGAFAATSEQLLDKAGYVRAVLAPAAGTGTGGN
ncbi:MAG: monovalent cation/H+ antiporter subunit D, partial [Bosea sp. (in: a-proteobacteria)]|nr:monovalent cation/H+ antiporter subunit D [Bosea sp. (in: a-proteobacteria)]